MAENKHETELARQVRGFLDGRFEKNPAATDLAKALNELSDALKNQHGKELESQQRMDALLDVLIQYTVMDFSTKATTSEAGDRIDALAAGLNALGEELAFHTKSLEDREEQINTIFRGAPDAVVVTNARDEVVRWNPAAEKMFGWDEKQILGKVLHEVLIPETSRNKYLRGLKHFARAERIPDLKQGVEMKALHKDGTEVDIELTFSAASFHEEQLFIAFLRDITERKKSEEKIQSLNATLEQRVAERTDELHRSEEKYRNLFELSPMPKWVLEIPSLRFIDVNEAAVKHYGYSREEFLSMNAADIRPKEEKAKFLEHIGKELPSKGSVDFWKHVKKDGTTIDVEIRGREISLEDGRRARLIIANDVTERNRTQQQIEEMNQELELRVAQRTQQLEAINAELESFSYSVSHDLRAPLRAINGYARIIQEDYESKLDDEGRRLLGVVMGNARKMGQLIDELLEFSRLGKRNLNLEPVNVAQLVTEVVNDLKQLYTGTPKITVHPMGEAVVDKTLLLHVLQNLVSNAFKFSAKKESPEIEIGMAQTENGPAYFVKDNGAGFDMAYYNKLFGVFQRLHNQEDFEGTGVGLAIVKRIVTRHGGQIWAEAKEGEGAVFYFTLGGGPLE